MTQREFYDKDDDKDALIKALKSLILQGDEQDSERIKEIDSFVDSIDFDMSAKTKKQINTLRDLFKDVYTDYPTEIDHRYNPEMFMIFTKLNHTSNNNIQKLDHVLGKEGYYLSGIHTGETGLVFIVREAV